MAVYANANQLFSLTKAVGSQQIRLRGPVFKITPLADLFNQTQTLYPDIL